jgi:glycosyltransferase involved in cell wall biosynthesis
MRLIILNQFFYPDHSATSQLMTDLGQSLVEKGLQVTALAGRGRYNGGESLPRREIYGGVHIERAWATSFGKDSAVGRLIDYLSFYLGACWKLLTLPRHDIVMALTTPPLISLLALLVCRIRGMKLVALVQDIYPDVAVSLGTLKADGFLTRILDRFNRFTLRKADRVIVLGDCMREKILQKIGDKIRPRLDVIHNWADGTKIRPLEEDAPNRFVEAHHLLDKFVVLFSGNLGRVNDFSTVLDAARLLRERSDIHFLFIGDGAKAIEIKEFIRAHRLENINLLPYQPRDLLHLSLAAGHAHLVTLAEGLAGLSVPSKAYGILAAGRPIIFVGDSKSAVARFISENGCGAIVAVGESQRLAEIIAQWEEDRERIKRMGREARELFDHRFDRPLAVSAYLESFSKCITPEASLIPQGHSSITSAKQRN